MRTTAALKTTTLTLMAEKKDDIDYDDEADNDEVNDSLGKSSKALESLQKPHQ